MDKTFHVGQFYESMQSKTAQFCIYRLQVAQIEPFSSITLISLTDRQVA